MFVSTLLILGSCRRAAQSTSSVESAGKYMKAYPTFQGVTPGTFITDHTWTNDDRLVAVTDAASVLIIDEGVVVQTIEKTHSKPGGLHQCVPVQGFNCLRVDGRIVLVDMVAPKEKLDGRLPFRLVASFKGIKEYGSLDILSSSISPKKMSLLSCSRIILPRLLWVMHI